MDQIEAFAQPAIEALKNPYVVGVVGILALVYGNLLAPNLPPNVALWFDNPIVKVLAIFLILAVRQISPIVAIILTLGLVISLQTLHRYNVMSMGAQVSQMATAKKAMMAQAKAQAAAKKGIKPSQDELAQLRQELDSSMKADTKMAPERFQIESNEQFQDASGQPSGDQGATEAFYDAQSQSNEQFHGNKIPDATQQADKALHPMNRPTAFTNALMPRVEDPDDPSHPGWATLGYPNVDISLYDLNPPYLRLNLPNQMGKATPKPDDPRIYPPQFRDKLVGVKPPHDNARRYSAYHGHPVHPQKEVMIQPQNMPYPSPQYNQDLANNLPSPYIPEARQQLPLDFVRDPALPSARAGKSYVSAKLGPTSGDSIGPQGLNRPMGWERLPGGAYP